MLRARFACTVVVVAGALLAAASGCGGAAASTSTLSWHRCDSQFECATLQVPVSYSNPGGPGASGVQYLEGVSSVFPASLRARFNLVSFDPRGDGSSKPLRCLTA